MPEVPSGTVTFLFTDIEGSTRRWEMSPDEMASLVARHDRVIRDVMASYGGYVFATSGDGFSIAFRRAQDAVGAVVAAQAALVGDSLVSEPLRVRMAVNTGEAEERDGDYFGAALNETGRLMAAGHGGQVLVSGATREVLGSKSPEGVGFLDLGEHRLRDVARPLRVFQLTDPRLPRDFPALRTLEPVRGNLPVRVTSFVGRDPERAELEKLLRGSRVVTVTGAGGAGKTRLAIEVASGLVDEFPDGVWFADLGSLSDPDLILSAVAQAMGLPDPDGDDPLGSLVVWTRGMKALVILDSCEHLIEQVRPLAAGLAGGSECLRILATSRERLGIQGEVLWPLPPLQVPDPQVPFDEMRFFDSIRLFEDRGDAASPGFSITPGNADAVRRICRRLDGIPLGLELAAARLPSLSAEDIATRLERSLAILGGSGTDVAEHHRSLRAAVDWSVRLLDRSEQTLLARLAVFSGGWTLEAAERITAALDDRARASVVELLSSLVDKSLVTVSDGATGRRYRLLEPIREHSAAALDASGERPATEERHAEFFAQFAEQRFADGWELSGSTDWMPRLEADIDNLRLGLEWHLRAGEIDRGSLMAGALNRFWLLTRRLAEAARWRDRFVAAGPTRGRPLARALLAGAAVDYWRLDEAIDLYRESGPSLELASVLEFAGFVAELEGNWQRAAVRYKESHTAVEGVRSGPTLLGARLGRLKAWEGDLDGGARMALEALQDARRHGTPRLVYLVLLTVGSLEVHRGNHDGALRAFEEALELESRTGAVMQIGQPLSGLAEVAMLSGDFEQALAYLRRLCTQAQSMPFDEPQARLAVASWGIQIRGEIDIAQGYYRRGVTLLAVDTTLRESRLPWLDLRWVRDPFSQQRVDAALDTARTVLGETAFETAWSEGAAMSTQDAISLISPSPDPGER